jgi:hypothetical protein
MLEVQGKMFAEQGAGNACILSLRARQNLTCLQHVLEFKDSSEGAPQAVGIEN